MLRAICQWKNSNSGIFKVAANLYSNKQAKINLEERVVITDDGSVVVCWHPKKSFPYECTRPLPEEATPVNSVLKVQNKSKIYDVFKTKNQNEIIDELTKITHTTKHRWYPNSTRHKKLYKRIKGDREYL